VAGPHKDDVLDSLKPDLDRCNKCGFCMAGCPTYRVGGQLEWLVTRGRVSLVQDALAGNLAWSETAEAVDTCLLCDACMDHCPPQVPIGSLMSRARAVIAREKPLPLPARLVLRHLLPYPGRLRLAARIGAVGERMGLRKVGTKLLKSWPVLKRANAVGPALSPVSARHLLKNIGLKPVGVAKKRVAYYITCTRENVFPWAAVAAVRVLVAAGCEVVLPDLPCCGLPCASAGDLEGESQLAERHRLLRSQLDVDALVVDDGSCAAHLHETVPVAEFSTFLAELGLPEPLNPVNRRVTWHDPCSMRHTMKVWAAPRRLIRAIPGIEYVEATDTDVCCGGAGSFMITQPDLCDKLLDLKSTAFEATEAELVVTSSPSCLMQLGRRLPMVTLAELLEAAYCPPLPGQISLDARR